MHKSVLIVDDVELSREIIKSSLIDKNKNISVVTVENAYSAIYKMRNKKFDLVIMDIMMPNGDGFELLDMLSQLAISTRVIIISSLDSSFIEVFAKVGMLYELDIVATYEKPIKSIELADKISGILELDTTPNLLEDNTSRDEQLRDYPVGVYYQPSVLTSINKVYGLDVTSNWEALEGSPLLSSSFLPAIENFFHKRFFNQVFIAKFTFDYKKHFQFLNEPLQFTIYLNLDFFDDEFIVNCLISIIQLNVNHAFKFFVNDTYKLSKLCDFSSSSNSNVKLLLDKGLKFVLECNEIQPPSLLCESVLPVDEVKFSAKAANRIASSTSELPVLPERFAVTFDGIENTDISNELNLKGFHRQQGILFGSPISAPTMLERLPTPIKSTPIYSS